MIRTIKNIIIGLILAFISISLLLLASEGILRLYDSYIATLKFKPTIDDGGPRLVDYTLEKPHGVFRILVLGDSIAYGQGVHKSMTFSKVLENMLNDNEGKNKFEVINTGFQGIDTSQELNILLNKGPDPINRPELPGLGYQGLAYKPDMIILQYTLTNDALHVEDMMVDPRLIPHGRERFKGGNVRRINYGAYALPIPYEIDKWLTRNSMFYKFFLVKYHGFLTKIGLRDEIAKVKMMYQNGRRGWYNTRHAIIRIGEIAKSINVPAVMVIWASRNDTPFKDIHELVGKFGGFGGFHVLDLAEAVKWPDENFAVSKTDGHPNSKAHKIAGEAIFRFIKEKELVSG